MTPKRLLATAAVWAVLSLSLWASDASPAVVVLAGVTATTAAVVFATYDLMRTAVVVKWTEGKAPPSLDLRADKLLRHLNIGVRYGSTELHQTLVTLIDDRLQVHHGIDREAAPEAALTVLTPRLQRLTSGPRRGDTAPRELQRILSDIEEL